VEDSDPRAVACMDFKGWPSRQVTVGTGERLMPFPCVHYNGTLRKTLKGVIKK